MILPFGSVYPVAAHSIDGLSLLVEKITLSTRLTLQRHEVSLQSSLNCLCVKPELRTGRKSDPDWAFLHSAPCAAPHSALERCRMLLYKLHIGMDGVKLYTFPLSFKNVNYGAFHNSAPCAHCELERYFTSC